MTHLQLRGAPLRDDKGRVKPDMPPKNRADPEVSRFLQKYQRAFISREMTEAGEIAGVKIAEIFFPAGGEPGEPISSTWTAIGSCDRRW